MVGTNPPKKQNTDDPGMGLFVLLLSALASDGLHENNAQHNNILDTLNKLFNGATLNTKKHSPAALKTSETTKDLAVNFNSHVKADTPERAAQRNAISAGIGSISRDLQGTKYVFGGKNKSGIDCSGFVAAAVKKAISLSGTDNAVAGKFVTSSQGQLTAAIKQGVPIIREGALKENIKAGMIIHLDTGEKSWDKGRAQGIDHVVITYEKDGEVFVAESSSGKGVHDTPAQEWLAKWDGKAKLYAADLVDVAEASTGSLSRKQEFKNNFDQQEVIANVTKGATLEASTLDT